MKEIIECLNPQINFINEDWKNILEKEFKEKHKTYSNLYDWSLKAQKQIKKLAITKNVKIYDCKKCESCLLRKRYDWIKRAKIESKKWKYIYFLTLTFNNKNIKTIKLINEKTGEINLQKEWYLKPRELSLFINKKLKKLINDFSYLGAGEYGSKTKRKHYHLLLFTNFIFDDLEVLKKTEKNQFLYISKSLNKLWNKGFCSIEIADNQGAFNYLTKYSTKEWEGITNKQIKKLTKNKGKGEHMIFSKNFGAVNEKEAKKLDIKEIPKNLIKNAKQLIYTSFKKVKNGQKNIKDHDQLVNKKKWILDIGEQKYNWYLNHYLNNLKNQNLNIHNLNKLNEKLKIKGVF